MRPLTLRFTHEARQHIEAIHDYIAERNPLAAARVVVRIAAAVGQLRDFPQMGRAGVVAGTREWVVQRLPYIVVYEVEERDGLLTILDVFHGAQDRPRGPG